MALLNVFLLNMALTVFVEVLTGEEMTFIVKNILFCKDCDQGRSSSTTSHSHCLSISRLHLTSELDCISGYALSTTYHTNQYGSARDRLAYPKA